LRSLSQISIAELGKKYYRLAELGYYDVNDKLVHRKYFSRYTPILPSFPYNLHLEITTSKIDDLN